MKFLLIEMIHPPPSHHPLKSTTSQSQSQSESQMGSQRGRRWTGRGLAHVSSSSSPLSLWWCLSLTLLWLSRPCCTVTADASTAAAASSSNYFNFEVEKRILERLDFFLGGPVGVNEIIKNFRTNGGFPNDMWAADRDLYLSLAYAMPQPLVYFGLEDGTCSGFYWSNGYYREPGNAGYSVDNPLMEQHLNSCIDNDTGAPAPCLLPPGSSYIACQDGLGDETGVCEVMKPCLNQHQQEEQEQDMSGKSCADDTNTSTTCPIIMDSVKWCRQYTIEVATPAAEDPTNNRPNNNSNNNGTAAPASSTSGRGFVPLTNMCITPKGQFSQAPKQVIDPLSSSRDVATTKTCTYASGEAVQRSLSGPYAACGLSRSGNKNSTTSMENAVCDTVFQGGYESWEYDPRYRPWYTVTKELQKSHWTKPFTFFALAIGMTYATPIYSIDDATGRQVFAGVLAVDYRFEDIARFLLESYGNSSSSIVIYEDDAPNYLIGTSTGIDSANFMLTDDLTQPCPVDRGNNVPCTPVRVAVLDIGGGVMNQDGDMTTTTTTSTASNPMNLVLARAAQRHMEAGYPQNLLSLKGSENTIKSQVYVSQSTLYTQPGAELAWRIIIVAPGASSVSDSITLDTNSSLVVGIAIVGALGVFICSAFLYIFYSKRLEKAVVFADWRFTCAFICGCILLNGSTFTLLGENTDFMCMLRLWTFHIFLVLTLSPLFVKVWRIYKLVGTQNLRRYTIPNSRAGLYTMPMIVIQVVILLVFTFVDPPRQMEIIEENGSFVVQRIVCGSDSNALFYTLGAYEGIFVFVGCFLAYLTRKLQNDFGESKQLIFSMYNIAFVGIMVVIISQVAGLDGNGQSMMQAVGVFWGTITSTGAFVIPRLIQVRERQKESRTTSRTGKSNVKISGLSDVPMSDFCTSHIVTVSNPRFAGHAAPISSSESDDCTGEVDGAMNQSPSPLSSNVVGSNTPEPKQTQLVMSHYLDDDEEGARVPSAYTGTQDDADDDDNNLIPNHAMSSLREQAPSSEGQKRLSLSSTKRIDWTGTVP